MTAQKFVDYIRFEKRYSEHTIKAYQTDITQFSVYLRHYYEIEDLSEASHQMIRSWIIHLMESEVKTRSINRKLSALKSFFRYLHKNNHIESNPFNKVIIPKTSKSLPHFIQEDKMFELLESGSNTNDFNLFTESLIIEILYATGIRVSELTNLKISDLDLDSCQIKVLGKRNKERLIPFTNILKDRLKSYLSMKQGTQDGPETNTHLFTTKKGKKMYPRLVYAIVNRNLSLVSTQKKKSPHVLRHTFATHMLNNGADLNSIKELLGHASLSATQVYTHTSIGQLKSIYKLSHPREKIKEE